VIAAVLAVGPIFWNVLRIYTWEIEQVIERKFDLRDRRLGATIPFSPGRNRKCMLFIKTNPHRVDGKIILRQRTHEVIREQEFRVPYSLKKLASGIDIAPFEFVTSDFEGEAGEIELDLEIERASSHGSIGSRKSSAEEVLLLVLK